VQGQGARAGTDSDVAGGDVTLRVGLGTGAGTPAQLHLQGSKTSPTATNLQVAIRRSSYNLSKALTSGSATTVVSIPLGVDTALAGFLKFSIEAIDTTNHKVCVLTGTVSFAAGNSNGVFVASTPQVSTTLNPCTSSSTLTATWAQTGADPSLLRVTPTTNITPNKFQIVYSAENFSGQAPTY
jgi:hypothetical protein